MATPAVDSGKGLVELAKEVRPGDENLLIEVEEALNAGKLKVAQASILAVIDWDIDNSLIDPEVAQGYYNRLGLSRAEIDDIHAHVKKRPKRH